jgi:ribosomal protein L22
MNTIFRYSTKISNNLFNLKNSGHLNSLVYNKPSLLLFNSRFYFSTKATNTATQPSKIKLNVIRQNLFNVSATDETLKRRSYLRNLRKLNADKSKANILSKLPKPNIPNKLPKPYSVMRKCPSSKLIIVSERIQSMKDEKKLKYEQVKARKLVKAKLHKNYMSHMIGRFEHSIVKQGGENLPEYYTQEEREKSIYLNPRKVPLSPLQKILVKRRLDNRYESLQRPLILVKPNNRRLTTKEKIQKKKEVLSIKIKLDEKLTYSARKLNEVIVKLKGLYLRDAEEVLRNDNSKGSKLIKKYILDFKEKHKDEVNEPKRILRIKEAYVGRAKGHMLPMYRAKGRVNFIQRKKSSFSLILERVPNSVFCQEITEGKISQLWRHKFREMIYKHKLSYELVKTLSFMTNHRGMKFRRDLIRSMVNQIHRRNLLRNGKQYAKWLIRKELVKDLGKKLLPIYRSLLHNPEIENLNLTLKNEYNFRLDNYTKSLKSDI